MLFFQVLLFLSLLLKLTYLPCWNLRFSWRYDLVWFYGVTQSHSAPANRSRRSPIPFEDWQLLEEVDASDQHGRSLRALAVPPCSLFFGFVEGQVSVISLRHVGNFVVFSLFGVTFWRIFFEVTSFTERLFCTAQMISTNSGKTFPSSKTPSDSHHLRQWDPNGIKLAVASFDVTCRCSWWKSGGQMHTCDLRTFSRIRWLWISFSLRYILFYSLFFVCTYF